MNIIDVVTQPHNRGASLFPEKINGMYVKLDRPSGGTGALGTIWISFSPDLIHWRSFRPVLKPGYDVWNNLKVGPPHPFEPTKAGWSSCMAYIV